MGEVYGRLKIINTDAHELLTTKGRRKAKKQFLSATKWAVDNGAKVVLLAASTKRLFGRDAKELKEKFPNTIFTIGDNGTAHLLLADTLNAIKVKNISKEYGKIVILGAYGILGEAMVEALNFRGYKVIAVGDNVARLIELEKKYGIETSSSMESLENVDLVVACTHKKELQLNGEIIRKIKPKECKLVLIDVAEPANLSQEEYENCREFVTRQDAGNAYSKELSYVLGAFSYKKLSLSQGVVFGCFAEAMAIGSALKVHNYIEKDWFVVNSSNIKSVQNMFDEVGIAVPTPRCFGEKIN
jgi:predicted amino acid dehydrogenase